MEKYLDKLRASNVDAPLVKEFLEKGCLKPAITSLTLKINTMETQLDTLRVMRWEMENEKKEEAI